MQKIEWNTRNLHQFLRPFHEKKVSAIAASQTMHLPSEEALTPRWFNGSFALLAAAFADPVAAQPMLPQPVWWAVAAIYLVIFAAFVTVLIAGAVGHFWVGRTKILLTVALATFAAALASLLSIFIAIGYQVIGVNTSEASPVPEVAVMLLHKVLTVTVLSILALFGFVLFSAMVETFFPEKKHLRRIVGITVLVVTLVTVLYSIAMSIFVAIPPKTFFLYDASPLLISIIDSFTESV